VLFRISLLDKNPPKSAS